MDDTIPAPERSQTASDEPSPRLAVPLSSSASRIASDSETNRSDIAPKSKISPEEAEGLRAKALEILRAEVRPSPPDVGPQPSASNVPSDAALGAEASQTIPARMLNE